MRGLIVAKVVFDVIDRESEIKSPAQNERIENIQIEDGIHFNNVRFKYPTAPEAARDVLTNASFTIKSGTSTAIVGPSGSGKSTIVQLLNRYYDTLSGDIKFGKDNIKSLNLTTLRDMIGWVG